MIKKHEQLTFFDGFSLEHSVVHIYAHAAHFNWREPYKPREHGNNFGSGFFIDDQGHIITNAHVVEEARLIEIHVPALGRKPFFAQTIGFCPDQDLALLRLAEADLAFIRSSIKNFSYLPLGDSDKVVRTEPVLVLGYPLGQYNIKGSTGIVSGFESIEGNSLIQITAPINHGYSGGPLINQQGEVIGITLAISAFAENIGYAIPVNNLKVILPELLNAGLVRRPTLGVLFSNTSDDEARYLNNPVPGGLYINTVAPKSSAAAMGVQAGDMIYAINGFPVDSFAQVIVPWSFDRVSLFDLLNRLKRDEALTLLICRNGKQLTVRGTFAIGRPEAVDAVYPDYQEVAYEIIAGMVIMQLADNHIDLLVEQAPWLIDFDEMENRQTPALVISMILPGSLADQRESLTGGQIIDQINGQKVTTLQELAKAVLESKKSGYITVRTMQTVFAAFPCQASLDEYYSLAPEFGYSTNGALAQLKK